MNNTTLVEGLSDFEQQILMGRLYELLNRQTTTYLAGDSSSIPVETAEQLMRSILYTLRLALLEAGKPERELLTSDLPELLIQGQHILRERLDAARQLWEQACLTAPQIQNAYLKDTLSGFKAFFKYYDLSYFAHQIPCSIDYPLCVVVPEALCGVLYVEQWLRQLIIENWFLSRFSQQALRRLLTKVAAAYWEYPLNLCEQPLINAVGLAMLRRSVLPLSLSEKDCREIGGLLYGGSDVNAELDRGIASAAAELHAPKEAERYLAAVLNGILPRIHAARESGDVSGIFLVN